MLALRLVLMALIVLLVDARRCGKFDIFGGGDFGGLPKDCTQLDLYGAKVDDAKAESIAKALEDHMGVTWISLSGNTITDAGANKLAESLEKNELVTTLKLRVNKGITKATIKKIEDLCTRNKAILKQHNENITKMKEKRQRKVSIVKNGIHKTVLEEGHGDYPADGARIKAHYEGWLENKPREQMFDSSRLRRKPFDFTMGKNQVIKCWDQAFKTMRKGEKALLNCKSKFAYEDKGSPPRIPPYSHLNFEVELLDFTGPSKKTEL